MSSKKKTTSMPRPICAPARMRHEPPSLPKADAPSSNKTTLKDVFAGSQTIEGATNRVLLRIQDIIIHCTGSDPVYVDLEIAKENRKEDRPGGLINEIWVENESTKHNLDSALARLDILDMILGRSE